MNYPLEELVIPKEVALERAPFEEFKQDLSIVNVQLSDGSVFKNVMLLYPNIVIAVAGSESLPFNPKQVVNVSQSPQKLRRFKDFTWSYWHSHNATN
jgi:hypothetical protein